MIPISVVMSVCNDEQYVAKAIESILGQTFKNFEFIIINDGSTDHSSQILESYAAIDKRITLIHQQNTGLTKALNVGLSVAKGKYIARQDSNDISLPERFHLQYNFLEMYPKVAVCWPWFNVIDNYDNLLGKFEFPTTHFRIKRKLFKANSYPHTFAFFRRQEIVALGAYRNIFHKAQDLDLWMRVIEHYEVGAIPKILGSVRYQFDSITTSDSSNQGEYSSLAKACVAYRKKGIEKEKLQNFSLNKVTNRKESYSRSNLYLANLFLRSGKNKPANEFFRTELRKKFNYKLFLKYIMSLSPINWSIFFRFI